jgi:hypothetical protein
MTLHDRVAFLRHTRNGVPLNDGSNVASTEPAFGDVAGQDHVAVHVEGHGLPRVHGNESRHVGASVNLPNRAESNALAARRLDVSLNFADDSVRGLMRAGHVEGQMLTAQVRLQRLRIVQLISDAPPDFGAPALDGEDSRALAAVGAFRVVPEHELDLPHEFA